MNDQFMPHLAEQDRIEVLQTSATKIRDEAYDAALSPEEVENKKSEFVKNTFDIDDLLDEKKELVANLVAQIKSLKVINKGLRTEIKSKSERRSGLLYDVANYETGYMETYDKSGALAEKRRLTPEEKNGQSKLFAFHPTKTGTHD
jgi:chromosome segregation ATPase